MGDISDEYDHERPEYTLNDDGTFRLSARLGIDELGEIFGIDLEDEDVDTVGGLLAKHLGMVPIVGSETTIHGIHIRAIGSSGRRHQVDMLQAWYEPPREDEEGQGREETGDDAPGTRELPRTRNEGSAQGRAFIAAPAPSRKAPPTTILRRIRRTRHHPSRRGLSKEKHMDQEYTPLDLSSLDLNAPLPTYPPNFRSGFASLVGRPNAGKSTLTNALVGQKVAITSNRPQTTRHTIRGIVHKDDYQLILVDTPGIHRPRTLLGERLNDLVAGTLSQVDVLGFCIPANEKIGPGDRYIASQLVASSNKPVVAIVTKADTVNSDELREQLLAVEAPRRGGHERRACPAREACGSPRPEEGWQERTGSFAKGSGPAAKRRPAKSLSRCPWTVRAAGRPSFRCPQFSTSRWMRSPTCSRSTFRFPRRCTRRVS